MNNKEIFYLLLFNRVSNYSSKKKLELLKKYGNFEKIFSNMEEVFQLYGKPFKIGGYALNKNIINYQKRLIEREIDYYNKKGIAIIDYNSPKYPDILRKIYDPPIVLFAKGNEDLLNNQTILSVVGSRNATNRGLTSSYNISFNLSEMGITIVSGLAKGIDSYAHKGAINGIGSTIAVMATGMNISYPPINGGLREEISKRGLVISEFPLGTPPLRYNFPRRNRIISGLADATLVVQASKKSGALITAQYALEQGKDVMALPGKARSDFFGGNNLLIKEGAYLVEDYHDILDLMGKKGNIGKELVGSNNNSKLVYSNIENDILTIMGDDTISLEEIGRELSYPISRLISTLIMLEINGIVKQKAGKYFYRVQ